MPATPLPKMSWSRCPPHALRAHKEASFGSADEEEQGRVSDPSPSHVLVHGKELGVGNEPHPFNLPEVIFCGDYMVHIRQDWDV